MSLTIQPDQFVAQELESRGVDSSVGVYGSHHVQIGKGTPVRIDQIKSASLPYAGIKTATQVRRGLAGVEQTSRDVRRRLMASGYDGVRIEYDGGAVDYVVFSNRSIMPISYGETEHSAQCVANQPI